MKEKLKKVIEKIGNLHESKIKEIENIIKNNPDLNVIEIIRKIKSGWKSVNKYSKLYWIYRGWPEEEAYFKAKEARKQSNIKRLSPFSLEYWLQKGYSKEEAEYKRNSIRPIRKEYWIERGYSEEEAIELAKKVKERNNKKGALKSKNKSKKFHKMKSVRCIEHWLQKGYSEEEARKKVSEHQSTFSLKKCIEKYGEKQGFDIWKKRQEKWIETLKNSEKFMKNKNKRNYYLIRDGESNNEYYDRLKNRLNLFYDINDYKDYLVNVLFKEKMYLKYIDVDYFIEKYMLKTQKTIFENQGIDIKNEIKQFFNCDKHIVKNSKTRAYRKWVNGKLLRSSYEIYFYEKIKRYKNDDEILIDGFYPNSDKKYRYDFYIDGDYIEISPEYDKNDEYRKKIDKKVKLFGCKVLKSKNDIDKYIEEKYESNN